MICSFLTSFTPAGRPASYAVSTRPSPEGPLSCPTRSKLLCSLARPFVRRPLCFTSLHKHTNPDVEACSVLPWGRHTPRLSGPRTLLTASLLTCAARLPVCSRSERPAGRPAAVCPPSSVPRQGHQWWPLPLVTGLSFTLRVHAAVSKAPQGRVLAPLFPQVSALRAQQSPSWPLIS